MKAIYQFYARTPAGPIVPGATITVFDADNATLSVLWEDSAGATPKTNPFITGPDGLALFYVDPGRYNVKIFDGLNTAEINDVPIGAVQNSLDASNASDPIDSRLDALESSDAGQDIAIAANTAGVAQNTPDIASNTADINANSAAILNNAIAIGVNASDIVQNASDILDRVLIAGSTSTGTQTGPRFESDDGQTSIADAGVWDNGLRVYSEHNTPDRGRRGFVLSLSGATATVIRDTRSAISSVVRLAVGCIEVNLSAPMLSSEYIVMGTGQREAAGVKDQVVVSIMRNSTPTTTQFILAVTDGSSNNYDAKRIYISVWEA